MIEEILLMTKRIGNLNVVLFQGNIAELETDAIVNAANEHLLLGSGVAGAIRELGGESIQDECYEIEHCPVGSAVITGGGLLKAKHVIHAVGPMYGEGDENNKLRSAIRAAILLAEENKLTSIAIPALGTGFFHFPMKDCASITINEITSVEPLLRTIKLVVLCVYDEKAYAVFESVLNS